MTEIASALKRLRLRAVVKARPMMKAQVLDAMRSNAEFAAELGRVLGQTRVGEAQRVSVH